MFSLAASASRRLELCSVGCCRVHVPQPTLTGSTPVVKQDWLVLCPKGDTLWGPVGELRAPGSRVPPAWTA